MERNKRAALESMTISSSRMDSINFTNRVFLVRFFFRLGRTHSYVVVARYYAQYLEEWGGKLRFVIFVFVPNCPF